MNCLEVHMYSGDDAYNICPQNKCGFFGFVFILCLKCFPAASFSLRPLTHTVKCYVGVGDEFYA